MDAFVKDLKHSARMFLQTPSFTIAAIAALALGIATNTAIFSVVNTVLLKPFAYPDPDRIVMFQNIFPAGRSGSAAPTEFNWWRQQTQAFQDVSAYEFNIANLRRILAGADPDDARQRGLPPAVRRQCAAGPHVH